MAYTKQNFTDGKVLTAAQLNHIEQGISDLEAEVHRDIEEVVTPLNQNVQALSQEAEELNQEVQTLNMDVRGISDGTTKVFTDATLSSPGVPPCAATVGAKLEECNEKIVEVAKAVESVGSAIVCESSGDVIALKDASNHNLEGLVLYGKTTQNGTPTPEAPIELVSAGADGDIAVTVAGNNLLDISKMLNDSLTDNGDGTYTMAKLSTSGRFSGRVSISLIKGTKVRWKYEHISSIDTSRPIYTQIFNKDGSESEFPLNAEYIVPKDTKEMRLYLGSTHSIGSSVTFKNMQLEIASATALSYEPFKELQTITIPTENGLPGIPVSSGGNYTDENGQQWVTDEVDLARGVYVQRVKQADWSKFYLGNSNDINSVFRTSYHTDYLRITDRKTLLCSHLPAIADTREGQNAVLNKGIGVSTYSGAYTASDSVMYAVFPKALVGTTKESFQAYIAAQKANGTPVILYYPSVEPIETPLTADEMAALAALHTNKLNTTVFNDSGAGQKVEYVADTKAYIDQKIAAISAAVLNA